MLWVIYALLSAFSFATADAFTKKASDDLDNYVLILSRFLYGAPFVLLLLFFIPMPKIEMGFWLALIAMLPFEILAWVLYIKAIKSSQISLVLPFLSFTPAFLVIISFLILGELPSLMGLFGIFLVVAGAYVLNLKNLNGSILEPVKSILREKGALYMLIVAFLFSITSSLSKILVQKSSPLFSSAAYLSAMALSFLAISFFASRKNMGQLKTGFKGLLPVGIFYAIMVIFHNLAITLTIVPYMMSIKRTSSIFSVLYGHFWFKDENIKMRGFGALIMLMGAVLIILS
ncbi:MAG: EamA family transporter [Nanoarchaeota archaeon]